MEGHKRGNERLRAVYLLLTVVLLNTIAGSFRRRSDSIKQSLDGRGRLVYKVSRDTHGQPTVEVVLTRKSVSKGKK